VKIIKTVVAFPIIILGIGVLSIGSALFCSGCFLAEASTSNSSLLKRNK
jgi:hypothetical protein